MPVEYYCDKCSKKIVDRNSFEMNFFELSSGVQGLKMPLLCSDCIEELKNLIKKFIEEDVKK